MQTSTNSSRMNIEEKQEETHMIKIYGMPTCPYCSYVEKQIEGNSNFQYIDIGSNVRYMHEFLELRDHDPIFDHSKAIGDVGIPCFVREDGTVSLKPEDFGLVEYGSEAAGKACSIDGKGC